LLGGGPVGYKPSFRKGGDRSGEGTAIVGPCMRESMGYPIDLTHCGKCTAKKATLVCAKCRVQVYCSKDCQVKDFHRHKVCCRTPEDAESMKDEGLWNNFVCIDKQSQEEALASFSKGESPLDAWLDLFIAKMAGMEHARHFGVMHNGMKLPR
jgi:hypothetical protein